MLEDFWERDGRVNWEMWGALGEIGGALAVVVSLLFVAQQIRQNSKALKAEAYRLVEMKVADLSVQWVQDPTFLSIFARLINDDPPRADFTKEERLVAALYMMANMRIFQACLHQYQEGIAPERILTIADSRLYDSRFVHDSWPFWREEFDPEFQEFFETRMRLGRKDTYREAIEAAAAAAERTLP